MKNGSKNLRRHKIKINTQKNSRSRSRSNRKLQKSVNRFKLPKHENSTERKEVRIPKRKLIVKNLKSKKGERLTNLKFSRRSKKRESDSVSQSTTPKSKKFLKYSKGFSRDVKKLKNQFNRKTIVMTSPKTKNVVVSVTREEAQDEEEKRSEEQSAKEESIEEKPLEMESSAEQKDEPLIEVKEVKKVAKGTEDIKDIKETKAKQQESGNQHAGSVVQPQPDVDSEEKPTVEEETAEECIPEKLEIKREVVPPTKSRKESPDPRENIEDSMVCIKSVDKMSTCKSPALRENKTLLDSCERKFNDDEFYTESSRKVLTT